MKLNIKALAATALMGLTLVSCNNNFDEDGGVITYPERLELGSYSNEAYNAAATSYVVNLYVNETGDTLANVSIFNPISERSNVLNGGKVSYDSKSGVTNIHYEESIYGTPALVSIASTGGGKTGVVNIYTEKQGTNGAKTYSNVDRFMVNVTDTISVLGQWSIGNGQDVTFYNDGSATFTQDEVAVGSGKYTFDGKSGSVTTTEGKTYTLSMNARRELQMNIDGNICTPSMVPSVYIDDWVEMGTGTFISSAFGAEIPKVPYEFSECRGEYRFNVGLLFNPNGSKDENFVVFNYNKKKALAALSTSTLFSTSQRYGDYGIIWGRANGTDMKVDDEGTLHFSIEYFIPNVSPLGSFEEGFKFDGSEE